MLRESDAMGKGHRERSDWRRCNVDIDAALTLRQRKCRPPALRIVQSPAEARTRGDAPRHGDETVGRRPRSPTRKPPAPRGSKKSAAWPSSRWRIGSWATAWNR
jgi:hypothetical protein